MSADTDSDTTGTLMAAGIFLVASDCQSEAAHMATQVGLDHDAVIDAAARGSSTSTVSTP